MNTQNVKTAAHESSEIWGEGQYATDSFSWDVNAEAAYWQLREISAKTEPEEITMAEFMDAIAVMYPLDWQGSVHSESFKLAEMYCGNVTCIYAKVGERYFSFRDVVTLNHVEIIVRIDKAIQKAHRLK